MEDLGLRPKVWKFTNGRFKVGECQNFYIHAAFKTWDSTSGFSIQLRLVNKQARQDQGLCLACLFLARQMTLYVLLVFQDLAILQDLDCLAPGYYI